MPFSRLIKPSRCSRLFLFYGDAADSTVLMTSITLLSNVKVALGALLNGAIFQAGRALTCQPELAQKLNVALCWAFGWWRRAFGWRRTGTLRGWRRAGAFRGWRRAGIWRRAGVWRRAGGWRRAGALRGWRSAGARLGNTAHSTVLVPLHNCGTLLPAVNVPFRAVCARPFQHVGLGLRAYTCDFFATLVSLANHGAHFWFWEG